MAIQESYAGNVRSPLWPVWPYPHESWSHGPATWVCQIWWYTVVSNYHTYCGPYMSLLSSSIYIVACVVIADSHVNIYNSCSSQHSLRPMCISKMPTLSHMGTWDLRDNIYTYCGLCDHTPTTVGHMDSTIWAVRMQWYNMVFSCDTYCGPCGHIQDAHVNINNHYGPCGHLRVKLPIWAVRMWWYNMVSTCHTVRLIWPYRSLLFPTIHIAAYEVIADWMAT